MLALFRPCYFSYYIWFCQIAYVATVLLLLYVLTLIRFLPLVIQDQKVFQTLCMEFMMLLKNLALSILNIQSYS